jgi:uncharacterized Zn-finger protein
MNSRTFVLAATALVAFTACGSGKSGGTGSPAPSPAATGSPALSCNGESPVWALQHPKVYLLPGDRLYGKTKHGEFICRSQAHAEGYRPARGSLRHRNKSKGAFSV